MIIYSRFNTVFFRNDYIINIIFMFVFLLSNHFWWVILLIVQHSSGFTWFTKSTIPLLKS